MPDAITIEGLTKTFGAKQAVTDLHLRVPAGSVCAFLGPNGAGKTTTIRMIMSILFPDRGRLSVLGRASALESKDRIGYLPEERGVYRKMRVGAFLRYMARLKGVPDAALRRRVPAWLERVRLAEVESKRCEELSKGMQQKVQFIASVIHEPELIILDEPFSGLDPVNALLLRELIDEQHRAGRTLIFSTHVMAHAEQLCDHVFMIDGGRKVLDESMASLRRRFVPHTLIVELLDDPQPAPGHEPWRALADRGALLNAARDGAGWELRLDERADLRDAMAAILASPTPVRRVEIKRPSLEDIFLSLVGRDELQADAPAGAASATPAAPRTEASR